MPLDLGTQISILDISLTLVGFGVTVFATLKAKRAAEAAEAASLVATDKLLKADVHAELATVLQLIEELKGLQRNKATGLLAERYSVLRNRVVGIRESRLIQGDDDMALLQDVVVRLKSLEKMILLDPGALENSKQLVRSNESLSKCSDSLLALKERIRIH